MLKMGGRGEVNGQQVQLMIIGLSHENLRRLRQGRPIKCKASDFGCTSEIPIEMMIFSGETEQSMARDMQELVGEQTHVSIDPRLRD